MPASLAPAALGVAVPGPKDRTPTPAPPPDEPKKSAEAQREDAARRFDQAAANDAVVDPALPFTPRGPAFNQTARLKEHQKAVEQKRAGEMPARAYQYKYLFVGGFSWDSLEDYFGPNIRRLQQLGLDAEFVKTDPLGRSEDNGKILAKKARESDKRVVWIAHSKGGNDVIRGLMDDPRAQQNTLAVVPIQSPLFGTAAAEWAKLHPWLYATAMVYSRLINPRRLLSINPFFRYPTVEELSAGLGFTGRPPVRERIRFYPVVSRVSAETRVKILMWLSAGAVKTISGRDNDGVVSPEDGVVPGHPFAFLEHVGHLDTVSNPSSWKYHVLGVRGHEPNYAADLTEAIVRWIFDRRRAT